MKLPMWFLVGLGAFVVCVLSCELISRADGEAAETHSDTADEVTCEDDLIACQIEMQGLLISCIADQVSMREIEVCPGFVEFMTACREGE